MRLFANAKFDFMKYRQIFIVGSLVLNVVGLGVFFTLGVNKGIDFTGGTELQVKFSQPVEVGAVRDALGNAGLKNPTVTTLGKPEDNEIYIRLASEEDGTGQDITRKALEAVRSVAGSSPSGTDLNLVDEKGLGEILGRGPGMTEETALAIAGSVTKYRREQGGLLKSVDELRSIPGMTDTAFNYLKKSAAAGPLSIRAQNYVGPSVAPELRNKALLAVLFSLLAMLAYIGWRFRFQWGLGAILATIHDVIITLGLFCISRNEFSLPVVASFLTLVGYSVNDTIVVFDRIRENLRLKGSTDLSTAINNSINQTLSRTIITSFLTWMVCVALWLLGGEALHGFAFVLVVGIIVGTYSSIYIASPVIIFWERVFPSKSGSSGRSVTTPRSLAGLPEAKAARAVPGKKAAKR